MKNYHVRFYGTMITVVAFVIFTVLKRTGVIVWSWGWVTEPIWIPFLIAVILVILFFCLLGKYSKDYDEYE